MTYNQDMIIYLQQRIQALSNEVEERGNKLAKLQERCDYLEAERQHLLDQLLDKPYVSMLRWVFNNCLQIVDYLKNER